MGIVNFFIALLDILLVIADVFAAIPVIFFVIMDIIMIIFTWLWPISMIKGVVQSIFTITKILLLLIFDIVAHILRQIFKNFFGILKGGLWGLPHTPEQHRSHVQLDSFDVQLVITITTIIHKRMFTWISRRVTRREILINLIKVTEEIIGTDH